MARKHVPKPTGRPRKARKQANLPASRPVKAVPRAPFWLSEPAKQEWRRAAAQLAERRTLTPGDLATLEAFCSAKGRLVMAEQLLAAEGLVVGGVNDGVRKRHPALSIINEASAVIRALGPQLGLTPASRRRAAIEETKTAEADPWQGLLDE